MHRRSLSGYIGDIGCIGSGGTIGWQAARLALPRRQHVGREFLVAKDGQPFLERELEPVAAGDPVAGPVVEILVTDDGLDGGEIPIGGDLRIGQHVLRVEDVQALVLHRAHVEVADGDDHEAVEIEFEAEAFLIPADRPFERIERMDGAALVAGFHPGLQQHLAPGAGAQAAFADGQPAGHQGKQIGRLRKRVVPGRLMPAGFGRMRVRSAGDQIAVGQQDRIPFVRAAQRHRVARHHVGAIRKPGDAPEALCLALGEQTVTGFVQAAQGGVGPRVDAHRRAHGTVIRQAGDRQGALVGVP